MNWKKGFNFSNDNHNLIENKKGIIVINKVKAFPKKNWKNNPFLFTLWKKEKKKSIPINGEKHKNNNSELYNYRSTSPLEIKV